MPPGAPSTATSATAARRLLPGLGPAPRAAPVRYAATYAVLPRGFDAASACLKNFVEKAARATLVGDTFDDAATGQGLLNYPAGAQLRRRRPGRRGRPPA
ncbi:MAG: hypothetical protein R3F59_29380 [Myxococcota bacterium]